MLYKIADGKGSEKAGAPRSPAARKSLFKGRGYLKNLHQTVLKKIDTSESAGRNIKDTNIMI